LDGPPAPAEEPPPPLTNLFVLYRFWGDVTKLMIDVMRLVEICMFKTSNNCESAKKDDGRCMKEYQLFLRRFVVMNESSRRYVFLFWLCCWSISVLFLLCWERIMAVHQTSTQDIQWKKKKPKVCFTKNNKNKKRRETVRSKVVLRESISIIIPTTVSSSGFYMASSWHLNYCLPGSDAKYLWQ
jgi:hypothetical protein